MEKLRILAVGAHPDDLEILCGGTLAKYKKSGHKVIMAHLLNGDKGHYQMDSIELAKIRDKESKNAGELIGAEVISLDLPDGELFSDLKTRIQVIDLVRKTQPDVIITHSPYDYMSDHTTTSQLVCDASFLASAPLFKTRTKAHNKIPALFFMDTVIGLNFKPEEYVDISEAFELKKQMLKQHKSQLTWLKEHDNIDVIGVIGTVARFRGLQCGVKYAEAFCVYRVWGRVVSRRVLP